MALEEVMLSLSGVLTLVAGAYVLSFRPLTPHAAILGASLGLGGVGVLLLPFIQDLFLLVLLALWGHSAAAVVFIATFPRNVPRSPATSFAAGAAVSWHLLSAANFLTGGLPRDLDFGMFDHLLMPSSIGGAIVVGLLVLTRIVDLGGSREPTAHAARILFITPLLILLTGGGNLLGQLLASAFGATDPPSFVTADSPPYRTIAGYLEWWILPGLLVAYALVRPRWPLPGFLMLAGFVTFLPIALQSDVDPAAAAALRLWGIALTPVLVMYTQARYRPFKGEPIGIAPTLVATAAAGFFAYLFVFVATLVVYPGEAGLVVGAALGLIAAIATARVAFPRVRRDELRNLFAPQGGSGALAPGRVVLGRYRVTRLIAEGGQGRVYEATDRRAENARVVLKAMTSDNALHEARVLEQVKHKNVVRLVDHVEITGLTFLVLEHVPGGDLRQLLIRRGGKLPSREAIAITCDVLEGLAAAHAHGIAHRDVKPENVLLDSDGTPKLIDFGIAKGALPGATARIASLGTLAYLAPEQARGEPGDARSDVYAVAVLCHELLTGKRPVEPQGDDAFLARRAIQLEAPRLALPAQASALGPVLARALTKAPEARYQTAQEMLAALKTTAPSP